MILANTTALREKLQKQKQLWQIRDEADDISATLKRLEALVNKSAATVNTYKAIRDRIPESTNSEIRMLLDSIISAVRASEADFDLNRRQVLPLDQIDSNVTQLQTRLANAWSNYVWGETGALLANIRLVINLSELQAKQNQLRADESYLQNAATSYPNAILVSEFDKRLANLRTTLAQLPGLSVPVLKFLEKVASNQASVADLTEEILGWLKVENRAVSFKIKLGGY